MTAEKKSKIIYWILTAPIILLIGTGGIAMLCGAPGNAEGLTHLGYPLYLAKILGSFKVLGALALLMHRFRTLKDWAYAGITFNLIGASASHCFTGDHWAKILVPLVMVGVNLISYRMWKSLWPFLRP